MLRKIFFFCLIILVFSGCEEGQGHFKVKIVFPNWQPVEGAWIEGGIDWDAFGAQTDSAGIAVLPSGALGEWALVFRNNIFPKGIILRLSPHYFSPSTYVIDPTPKQLRWIGNVEGWSISFEPGSLTTVDYHGVYHVYTYDDSGILEIASAQLPSSIRDTQLHGDILWFSTHDEGIYVYFLANPLSPQLLFHLNIPGYIGKFALKDGTIVVASRGNSEPIRVFSYDTSGGFQEIAQLGSHLVKDMEFRENFLVVVGSSYDNGLPAVYDLQDPANPVLIHESSGTEYRWGFLYGNFLILKPDQSFDSLEEEIIFKRIDISDPAHPTPSALFPADSNLFQIINETTALGRYYVWTGAISVLSGDITSGFQTIAIITDNTWLQSSLHEFEGCAPPYFIIGENLYKLEDW